jgi:CBS domain-containing protein/uncharacterized protein (DUF2267 family)
MSLRWYVRQRLVVLNPSASALEAARALENNNIGAVVVQQSGTVMGIVTDRDLTGRVVGQGRDPKTTTVGEIMSSPAVTLSPSDSQTDAIQLMRARRIRRVPLAEGGRAVGIVTLDDLLLDEAAPLDELSAVVEAQIGEGGPATPPSAPSERRRTARAEATYAGLLNELREASGLESAAQAETALEVVLSSLVRRLTADEARDLIAQLPSLLTPKLERLALGPDKRVTRESIETDLVRRLDVDSERAGQLLAAVADTLAARVSRGQMDEVQNQLPRALRTVFVSASP